MPRPIIKTYSPTALDRDGLAASQTPGGAGDLTLNGALISGGVATFTTPQHVTIYSGSNIAARVFTVTGTDRTGTIITETITGVNASTVAGTKNFKTVTQIAVDAGTGAAVEAGVNGQFEGGWVPMDYRTQVEFNAGFGCVISSGGAMTYSVQHTFDDVYASDFAGDTATAFTHADVTDKTANQDAAYVSPVAAVRVKVTAHTSGTLTLKMYQTGY